MRLKHPLYVFEEGQRLYFLAAPRPPEDFFVRRVVDCFVVDDWLSAAEAASPLLLRLGVLPALLVEVLLAREDRPVLVVRLAV
jgi:hypothetical protein